jgi:hypothetical protein
MRRKCWSFAWVCCSLGTWHAADVWATQEIDLLLAIRGSAEVYPVQNRSSAGYLTYDDRELIVQVTLSNASDDTLRVQRPHGWIDLVTLTFEAMDRPTGKTRTRIDLVQVVLRTGVPADPTTIGAHEAQEARVRIRQSDVPSPGTYRVRASVDRRLLSVVSGESITRFSPSETLEIRSATSTNDELNVLYTRATRLRLAGRHQEARSVLNQMVTMRPTSVIAWYELGKSWAAERDCQEAVRALSRADGLVDSGADPDELSARQRNRPELQREIRRLMQSCR